jgi:hypothetical protein
LGQRESRKIPMVDMEGEAVRNRRSQSWTSAPSLSLSLSLSPVPPLFVYNGKCASCGLAGSDPGERKRGQNRWWKREEWLPRLFLSSPANSSRAESQQGIEGEERRGERVVARCAFFAPDILARIGPLPHAPSLLHTRPSNLPFFSTCTALAPQPLVIDDVVFLVSVHKHSVASKGTNVFVLR